LSFNCPSQYSPEKIMKIIKIKHSSMKIMKQKKISTLKNRTGPTTKLRYHLPGVVEVASLMDYVELHV
jgi:hypothetical protein